MSGNCLFAELAGFLHFDEMINLRPCDFTFSEGMLKIHIVCSKTDQLRQGNEVLVARTNTNTYPVAMLECYMQRTTMLLDDVRPLFRVLRRASLYEMQERSVILVHVTSFRKNWQTLAFLLMSLVSIACVLGVLQQLLMRKFLIACLRGMAAGNLRLQRMVVSRMM